MATEQNVSERRDEKEQEVRTESDSGQVKCKVLFDIVVEKNHSMYETGGVKS